MNKFINIIFITNKIHKIFLIKTPTSMTKVKKSLIGRYDVSEEEFNR